jgi:uncharacterized protein (TIGR02145 family)
MKIIDRLISLVVMVGVLIFYNSCTKVEVIDVPTTVTDLDGNIYKTLSIGPRIWMAENLRTTRYNNGDSIGTTIPVNKNISGEIKPKYQWPNAGLEDNVQTWGRLYTWYAVKDSRGLCPTGWHIPSDEDWETLTAYLGGLYLAGYKLMEQGNQHWINNDHGNNVSGFTALGGGGRSSNGSFYGILTMGLWWSSSEDYLSEDLGSCRAVKNFTPEVSATYLFKEHGLSVRCVKTCFVKK